MMTSSFTIRPLHEEDHEGVRAIFNDYVEHSFAAYPQHLLSVDEIQNLLKSCQGFPALAAKDDDGNLIGFGFVRPYNPYDTFASTATITYFVAAGHTGKGLGSAFLRQLEMEARDQGISRLLAHVSSKNEPSLAFHRKHGFDQCGCFHSVGCKRGESFDIVWFEKSLAPPRS
jgi:L-amino acid N-acyltransferase YncA